MGLSEFLEAPKSGLKTRGNETLSYTQMKAPTFRPTPTPSLPSPCPPGLYTPTNALASAPTVLNQTAAAECTSRPARQGPVKTHQYFPPAPSTRKEKCAELWLGGNKRLNIGTNGINREETPALESWGHPIQASELESASSAGAPAARRISFR